MEVGAADPTAAAADIEERRHTAVEVDLAVRRSPAEVVHRIAAAGAEEERRTHPGTAGRKGARQEAAHILRRRIAVAAHPTAAAVEAGHTVPVGAHRTHLAPA